MKALQYRTIGSPPELVEIPDPQPGPGQILLRVTAAGICHSDLAVMSIPQARLPFALPLTLGHEAVGTVAGLGVGASGIEIGDSVAVYGPWGCGKCTSCAAGRENYCPHARTLGIHPPGLGAPGAIAEYMVVDDVRHLIPIGDLDPVATVPLTDAGLTPYHAISRALPKLGPGSSAVVIGAGGLGHVAIQLLRALTSCRIIGLDVSEQKLSLAKEVGAHQTLLSDESAAAKIRSATGGLGADALFDFVGNSVTAQLSVDAAAVDSDIQLVGLGGGFITIGMNQVPYGMSVTTPYWGSRSELADVLELAGSGDLSVHTETFTMDEAPTAYERLRAGDIKGRAVVLPQK